MSLVIPLSGVDLGARLDAEKTPAIVGFFGEFSPASNKARPAFEQFCAAHPDRATFLVDVGVIRDAHTRYGVSSVPTVVVVSAGRVVRRIIGAQTAEGYERLLSDHVGSRGDGTTRRVPRVTVYTTPSCSWCTRTKSYLRSHAVPFTEVDVARDEAAARRMVARSGQRGVPQIDIDGHMIVGFDKPRIDQLLGLGGSA